MRKFLRECISIGLIVFSITSPAWGEGTNPHISDLTLRQGEKYVLLSARLVNEFGEEMHEALQGGVPLTFNYRIQLTRKGSILGEKVVRSREIIHNLEYDPVKQLYIFKTAGSGHKPAERTTKEQDLAIEWLTNIVDWPLYPLKKLEKNVRYRVRVMATLKSVELPSVLGYLFFFTTIFNQETPWAQLDFTF